MKKKDKRNGTSPENLRGAVMRVFSIRDKALLLSASAVAAFFLCMISFPQNPLFSRSRYQGFEAGVVAERDLFADRSITYADEEATKLKIDARVQLVPPVFIVQEEISERVKERFEIFAAIYSDGIIAKENPQRLYLGLQAALPGMFSREDVDTILASDNKLELVTLSRDILETMLSRGVFNIPENVPGMEQGTIEIWYWVEGEKIRQKINTETIVSRQNLAHAVSSALEDKNIGPGELQALNIIVSALIEENTFYNADETEKYRERALEEVEPVMKTIVEGERIVKKGYVISPEDMAEIAVLNRFSRRDNINAVLGTIVILMTVGALALFLLNPPVARAKLSTEQVYLITALGFLYLVIFTLVRRFGFLPPWVPFSVFLPAAFASMIITVLINSRTAITFGLIVSFLVFTAYDTGPYPFIFSFLSAVAGAFVMRGTERRIDLVRANFYLAGISGVLAAGLGFLQDYEVIWFFIAFGWGALNGFVCGILNIGILPILEHVLDAPTRFRLLELSDINAPMLKKMLTLAPGTYSHSLSVANLAEAACREIDANPLLARVGAYYHDIGKIEQPEYFIENQSGDNKHDELKPSLSVAVIKSHVKIGVEKGKELGLPKKVLDIIAQHHGSGLISFFYSEALKKKGNTKIDRENFSYTEPPPASKEAAVVLLADSVEATARTLKKPTVAKLEKLIWNIIIDKFQRQHLNSSPLTFHDLEVIKKTFVHILAGYFHSRIEYPEVNEDAR